MLDIKLIQNDFENVAQSLKKKKVDEMLLKKLKDISLELKENRYHLEILQAKQNQEQKKGDNKTSDKINGELIKTK